MIDLETRINDISTRINCSVKHFAGEKAWLDTFNGKIRCKVLEVLDPGFGWQVGNGKVRIVILESRNGYEKGETFHCCVHNVVPLKNFRYNSVGQGRVKTNYKWEMT